MFQPEQFFSNNSIFEVNLGMEKKTKVIFICTGNACRSQMAEGLLREIAGDRFDVYSAGSHPSRVHPVAIRAMKEIGIDISKHTSDSISKYLGHGIDIVITVCDNAQALCPTFPGNAQKIHWSIKDPFRSWNKDLGRIKAYRKTRDEINERIKQLIESI